MPQDERKSENGHQLGSASRPPRTSTPSTGPALGLRRMATIRGPNGRAQRRNLAADAAQADQADRRLGQLSGLERLPGSLALQLEQLRQPPAYGQKQSSSRTRPMGRSKTPAAVPLRSGRAHRTHGVRTDSTPTDTEWIQCKPGCSTEETVQRVPTQGPASQENLCVFERLVRDPLGANRNEPRTRGGFREDPPKNRFIDPNASRPVRTGLMAIADGEPARSMPRACGCGSLSVHVSPRCWPAPLGNRP